jgi:hypothetical protein
MEDFRKWHGCYTTLDSSILGRQTLLIFAKTIQGGANLGKSKNIFFISL